MDIKTKYKKLCKRTIILFNAESSLNMIIIRLSIINLMCTKILHLLFQTLNAITYDDFHKCNNSYKGSQHLSTLNYKCSFINCSSDNIKNYFNAKHKDVSSIFTERRNQPVDLRMIIFLTFLKICIFKVSFCSNIMNYCFHEY